MARKTGIVDYTTYPLMPRGGLVQLIYRPVEGVVRGGPLRLTKRERATAVTLLLQPGRPYVLKVDP
ncbi:MAG: hypothetical protein HY318_17675 [Armatimonadetes bacterium]|nr:hypothetical protein [Armatimonadota bacterium]